MNVYVRPEPNDDSTFDVLVDGWLERWDLDRIKQAVTDGAEVKEWITA